MNKEFDFYYTNHKGIREKRSVFPISVSFGKTYFHGCCWYLHAYCCVRQELRDFKVKDIEGFNVQQIAEFIDLLNA